MTLVLNKIDLTGLAAGVGEGTPAADLRERAHRRRLESLREHLKSSAGYRDSESGALAARRRHLDALARARALVEGAAQAAADSQAFELFAEDLRLAQRALGEITGEVTQRGFARRDLWKLLYREVNGGRESGRGTSQGPSSDSLGPSKKCIAPRWAR